MLKILKNKKLISTFVVLIMVLSVFTVFTAGTNAASPTTYSIPNTPVNGFKFVENLNPNQTVTATISIPPTNIPLMQYYSQAISTPGSPLYHKFLSKNQILNKFINTAKYNQLLNYVSEKGLAVQMTAMNSVIVVSGTVNQIKDAFGMNVGLYSNGTAQYYNAYGTPSISGVYVYSSNISGLYLSKPSTLIDPQTLKSTINRLGQANPISSMEPYSPVWLQKVYNATGLYSQGIMGKGETIGLLDFGGDPYIQQQLNYFDSLYNLPNVNITISPIGPYDPMLGIYSGWAEEISIDVEISHTMAPEANITLYVENYNWNLLPAIAAIVSNDTVKDLSQSFSTPESIYYELGNASTAYFNVIFTDYYYLMGSLEGITFLASTGDAGASGYSAGPLGTPGYPSTSPWVTAIGGTTTYVTLNNEVQMDSFGIPINSASNVSSFNQTAWSNYGFVPAFMNYGGSTGGISMYETEPWYQSGINLPNPEPVGYPIGRMVPDLSFEASVYPGAVFVFPMNYTAFSLGVSGGTSEASPLFAGLLALTAEYTNSSEGLINPTIYSMGLNATLYPKIFDPVTFGYNIPYLNSYGYNLVTGFGSLNMGTFSYYLKQMAKEQVPALSIVVNTTNLYNTTPAEFPDGSVINVTANITYNNAEVNTGYFNITLQSLQGSVKAALKYNATLKIWTGTIKVPVNTEGMSFLYVTGESDGISGTGYTQLFLGYYVNYDNPSNMPLQVSYGFYMYGTLSLINGAPVGGNVTLNISVESYSVLNNTYYTTISAFSAYAINGTLYYPVMGNIPFGVALLVTEGAYGFMPFYNGVELQDSKIIGNIFAEPGVAAPGTNIFVEGVAFAPTNTNDTNAFYNVLDDSTITFSLLNSTGVAVSSVTNNYFQTYTYSSLYVPSNLSAGYYTIMITSSYYDSVVMQYLNGSFYGQIYVAPTSSIPHISTDPIAVYEGQNMSVVATIPAQNGTPFEYGMYIAFIYPSSLASYYWDFTSVSLNYGEFDTPIMVPLYYNTVTNEWMGIAQMPDGSNTNVLASIYGSTMFEPGYYVPGTYDLFIAGESASGIPTNVSENAQYQFILRQGPYLNILEPVNGSIAYEINSSTVNIVGVTTGVNVTINNKYVNLVNGSFNVTEKLVNGINVFNVVSLDLSGSTATQTVIVLYLPQIQSIQNQLVNINNTLTSVQKSISSQSSSISALNNTLNSLKNQLTALGQELSSLNTTYGIKVTGLMGEISTLEHNINSTQSQLTTVNNNAKTGNSNNSLLGILALALALIGLIIAVMAFFRKPKNPTVIKTPEEENPKNEKP